MKKIFWIIVLCIIVLQVGAEINPRIRYSINENWRFIRADVANALQPALNDSCWQLVNLPHTWNATDVIDELPDYYRGTAWYRRLVSIPMVYKSKQIFIFFEGANQEVELFVNGKSAGTHQGGYTRFCFDITNLVSFDAQNVFAVKVNNAFNENIPPLTADFTFFGGIYRDVYLIFTEKQHISTTHFASSGVFITTPKVTDKEASMTVKTLIVNHEIEAKKLIVENIIISPKAEIVCKTRNIVNLAKNTTQTIEQKDIVVQKPMLWSPDSPSLYSVLTRIYDAKTNKLLDQVSNPLGFRWFEFSAEKGFAINGKSLKLIGTNRHQCFEGLGNALPDEIHVRDIKLLKEMGANFLRISHYPQDPTVMEMCDKLGIICSVEIPIVNTITENEAFTKNCLTMAREMVMQDFNRPSVLIWAYMNEVLLRLPFKEDSVRNNQYLKSVEKLAKSIENQIRQDDPSRYTLIPTHGNIDVYINAGITNIPMIVGFNLYQGWYSGTFDGCDKLLDAAKTKMPNKPFIITEYGADVDPRLHSFEPQRFDYTAEYANLYHEHYIKTIMERSFVNAANIWNLNDFYSETRANAVPHVNNKGIVGIDRAVKDTYLQYQALLSKTPIVTIGGTNWKIRGGIADLNIVCLQPVKVYSNQKFVELSLNGKSIGKNPVIDNIAQFNVPFINGLNRLVALAESEIGIISDQQKIDFRAIPFNLKDNKNPFTEINVMLGSKRYFEDKTESVIWIPEKEYTSGSWGYIGGKPYEKRTKYGSQPASDLDILGTNNDPVFQTMRVGIEAFKMDVPDGEYTVSLYFAELQSNKEREASVYSLGNDGLTENFDKRIFDIDINELNLVQNLDLTKEYGEHRAVVKKFIVEVSNGEGISVNFEKKVGEPILNAIRIYRNY